VEKKEEISIPCSFSQSSSRYSSCT
jgi:hypothetical protein